MSIIIFLILIIVVLIFFKDVKKVIYFIGMCDVFFQITHYAKSLLNINDLTKFINTNIPISVVQIIDNSCSGLLQYILRWVYVILIFMFIIELIRYILKRR